MTLHDKLIEARERLLRADVAPADAAIDVELYARTILGWDKARLITSRSGPVPPELEPRFSEWLARRAQHEPTAYILGRREFWGLDFRVSPAVLIPRPETEFIVEEALALLRAPAATGGADNRHRIADIGTGSGCIAVALARELPSASVIASDLSGEALSVARQNAEDHGVAGRIEFVETSYLDGVAGTFDLITANPPYVRATDKPALSRVVRHEPDVALFGGTNGLRDIEGVLATAEAKLRPAGWFVMEFGFGQEDDVRALVEARAGLTFVRARADLQGIARTAIIQRQ